MLAQPGLTKKVGPAIGLTSQPTTYNTLASLHDILNPHATYSTSVSGGVALPGLAWVVARTPGLAWAVARAPQACDWIQFFLCLNCKIMNYI